MRATHRSKWSKYKWCKWDKWGQVPFFRKQFWGQHFWQIGYFVSTTGSVHEKTVREYIAEQGKKEEDEDKTFILLN